MKYTDEYNWAIYDRVARDMARRGLTGKIGDPLPNLLDGVTAELINDDPEAFQFRVRSHAYGIAMERIHDESKESS